MKTRFLGLLALSVAVAAFMVDRRTHTRQYAMLQQQLDALKENPQPSRSDRVVYVSSPMTLRPEGDSQRAVALPADTIAQTHSRDDDSPDAEGSESAQRERELQSLEHSYQQEQRDQAWARDSETQLRADLSTISVGQSTISGLDCRASLCKVDVVHHGEAGVHTFMAGLTGHIRWTGGGIFHRQRDLPSGDVESVMFLAKGELPLGELNRAEE